MAKAKGPDFGVSYGQTIDQEGAGVDTSAFDHLEMMAAGNNNLVTHPHLITALMSGNATVPQAQAINQFLVGMQAAQKVQLAQSAGAQVQLQPEEMSALGQLGINPGPAAALAPDDVTQIRTSVLSQLATQDAAAKGDGGWSFGRVWHDTLHNDVTDALGKGLNWVNAGVGSVGDTATGNAGRGMTSNQQLMLDLGYDPNSFWSNEAFRASGNYSLDIDDLNKKFGTDQVNEAVKFSADPEGYIKSIVNDPNLDATQIAAELDSLNDPTFADLAARVRARQSSVGNMVTINIDPIAHPDVHAAIQIPTDIVAGFMIDPMMAVGGALKAVRASQIAIDGVGSSQKVFDLVSGARKGVYAAQARRSVQTLVDSANEIRKATDAGDDVAAGASYARMRNLIPGLKGLLPDFIGRHQAIGFTDAGDVAMGVGKPITNMSEAADYLSSRVGLIRLVAGSAPREVGLFPGQLSSFGAKYVRANLAEGVAKRGLSKLDLAKPGIAAKVLATDIDRVDTATGKAVASLAEGEVADAATGLKSADRASSIAKGQALKDARTGLGPAAIANRFRFAVQRMGSYLPKDAKFATSAPDGATKVFQYANMWLRRSDANILAARYAAGDEGVRKAVLQGMNLQTLHAAGFGTTEAGRAIIDRAEEAFETQKYGATTEAILDPETGLRRDAALWPHQTQEVLTLKNFSELQQNAAKIGIWENTIGRALNNQVVDGVMSLTRLGWQFTGANVMRNAGDDLANAFARGELGSAMQAKIAGRAHLPARTKLGNRTTLPLAWLGRAYRKGIISVSSDAAKERMSAIADLEPDDLGNFADDISNSYLKSIVNPAGSDEVSEIAQPGYIPKRLTFRAKGYEPQSTAVEVGFDGKKLAEDIGAVRLANHLGSIVSGNKKLTSTILDHIVDGKPITDVVKALKADPRFAKMIRAGVFDEDGATQKAVTAADRKLAVTQLAEKQIRELRYLLSDNDGVISDDMVNHIRETGKAPDADWISDNLPESEMRPSTVLAPMWEATTKAGATAKGVVGMLSDAAGKGFQMMVDRPIRRLSSTPIFLDNYGRARVSLKGWEADAVAGGMKPEAAATIAKRTALQAAMNRTMKYIDDPTLRTQGDIVGRNFFAYSRATRAFIQRWAGTFVEDPTRLRKMALAYEAGVKSGLVYTDDNGEKQLAFPGSGATIDALMRVADLFPGVDLLRVPGVSPDLTGAVQFLSPGLQNPLQFSATPMINIPYRTVEHFLPQHREALDEVDGWFNGKTGQGASPFAEFEPTAIRKFTVAFSDNEKDGMVADAMRASLLNLSAAGKLPGQTDPAAKQKFLADLQVQTKSQLVLRALFGYFSPTPPGTPLEESDGSKADWFYSAAGVHGLDSEYKTLLNDAGGDIGRADQIWAALHPDKLAYTTGSTENMTKSAVFNATQASQNWLNNNASFMQNYSNVAAYFLPPADNAGDFDLKAYHAELELGIRQHKDIGDYYNGVVTANSAAEYYQALDLRNQALDEATSKTVTNPATGRQVKASTLIMDQWSTWNASFNSLNPLWAETQQDYSQSILTAQGQVRELQRLVANPSDAPSNVNLPVLANMLGAYDTYHRTVEQASGNTNAATAQRAAISGAYNQWWAQALKDHPEFGGLYAGVFRTLDNKVLDPIGSGQ